MDKQYTVILKRGSLPDVVRKHETESSALLRVDALLILHGVEGATREGNTFRIDASAYYAKVTA